MARNTRCVQLPPPYLRRLWFDSNPAVDWDTYHFCLPLFQRGYFEVAFDTAVTIIIGKNGTGKSTLLEAIAHLAGFDEAGRGKAIVEWTIRALCTRAGPLLPTRCGPCGCRY